MILCIPGAIPATERTAHFALATRLLNELATSQTALADGYEFRFPAGALQSIAQFIANERLCCPFMRFDIHVEPGASELILQMTGPVGTREVIETEVRIGSRGSAGYQCCEA